MTSSTSLALHIARVNFVILALLVAGCGIDVAPTVSFVESASLVAVPTQEPVAPGNTPPACPAAQVRGELVPSAEWGVALADEESHIIRQVIWPFGYVAEQQGERLALRAGGGIVVALTGDRLLLGGGEFGLEGAWLACGDIQVLDQP